MNLTANGQKIAQALADNSTFSFFDDGMVEGSETWSDVFAEEARALGFTAAQMGGIVAGLVDAGFFTHFEDGADSTLTLTAEGAAYVNSL